MLLNELIKNAPEIEISQLSCDSRLPMKDSIFFCLKGVKYNGHEYVEEAVNNGARVIIYSEDIDTSLNAIYIRVADDNDILAKISNIFYDNPSSKLETYLTAGSYGRSTVSKIINFFINNYKKCGYIGNCGIRYQDNSFISSVSSLPTIDNQKFLCELVKNGVEACTLEADYLSLEFKKFNFMVPDCFIYTNTASGKKILDEKYYSTYIRYLYTLDEESCIVLNADDPSFDVLYKAAGINKCSYGLNDDADFRIGDIVLEPNRSRFSLKYNSSTYLIETKLVDYNNIYNLTAAIAALVSNGYELDELVSLIPALGQIDGVVERLNYSDFNIYVDCAYTVDSYKRMMKFAERIGKKRRTIVIVSINTTDDKNRIQHIIESCDKVADIIILTEDDTLQRDIDDYLNLASSYVKKANCLKIEDRISAIEEAVELMNRNDNLFILGKGSEKFLYKSLIKQNYEGDKDIAIRYMNKRLREEKEVEN